MKRSTSFCVRVVVLASLLAFLATAAWAATLYVDRPKVDIKKGRGAFFPTIFTAQKGDALEVLTEQDGWYQVKTPKGDGWVFGKALTERKGGSFNPLASLVGTADTSDLDKTAGFKGFDAATEQAYIANNNLQAQLKQVEQLEKTPFSLSELKQFQTAGKLAAGGAQ